MTQTSNQTFSVVEHKKNTKEFPLVEVTKTFNAPVKEVFMVWTDGRLVKEWWGPQGFSAPEAKIDFKVGGKYLFAMKNDEGDKKTIWSTGSYLEIIPNKKIVFSDQFSDEKGNVISPKEAGFEGALGEDNVAFVTVEFESLGSDQSRLHLSHEGLPAGMHDECVEGWSSSLDKIKPLVEKH